jgi:hypothetical protein
MKLISNNLQYYLPPLHDLTDIVIRINLAWYNRPSLANALKYWEQHNANIFLDVPVGRTKPPCNQYSKEEVQLIKCLYPNIAYLAISNVETPEDLDYWHIDDVSLVPKIETAVGIQGIETLADKCHFKYVMLDHGDLFLDLQKNYPGDDLYISWIDPFLLTCCDLNINVLRERGLVFSDE